MLIPVIFYNKYEIRLLDSTYFVDQGLPRI